ncbi:MAG: DUF2007 domain-containing protein [Pseudomonadota bacterium]
MKVILRTHDVQHARIIVGYLVANGVDARLFDAEMATMVPFSTLGVRIAVDSEQVPKAMALLKEKGIDADAGLQA